MKIVINDKKNEYVEAISWENLETIDGTQKKFYSKKGPFEAKIFAINESINTYKLLKIKNNFEKMCVNSLHIYSNIRETVVAGKSLKIDSTFLQEQEVKKKLHLHDPKKKEGLLYEGTLRAGDRMSSNGNLFIIGDVNPGAIVSAKNNIYVWGKLLGIAFAGNAGDNNASIASLYLNPLQLRIADVIAIGPKDKPKDYYPEVAVIDNQTINIKPLIIQTIKNQ